LYLLQKSLPAAIQALETACYLAPRNAEPRMRLAQAYVDVRSYEEARRAIDEAIRLDPKSAYALSVRGELLLRQDRLKDSLVDFRAAIQLDPEFILAYLKAGFILNELQRSAEAIQVLEAGLKRDPNNPGLHFQLAESYFSQPQNPKATELAEQQYRLALPNNPSVANVYARLGELAQRRGDDAAAREQWEEALRLSSTETTALYGLAQLEARAGNRTRSAELTRRLTSIRSSLAQLNELQAKTETDPRNAALAIRAVRLALTGRLYAEASRQIERAVRWNPDNRALRELRGQLYLEQGKLEDARAEFAVAERLPEPK
jgi:predicted Zn-dependent protease